MSESAAKEVLKRAIKDEAFRKSLRDDFDATVGPFDLTDEEREALRSIDWSQPLPSDARVLGTWVHIYK